MFITVKEANFIFSMLLLFMQYCNIIERGGFTIMYCTVKMFKGRGNILFANEELQSKEFVATEWSC